MTVYSSWLAKSATSSRNTFEIYTGQNPYDGKVDTLGSHLRAVAKRLPLGIIHKIVAIATVLVYLVIKNIKSQFK